MAAAGGDMSRAGVSPLAPPFSAVFFENPLFDIKVTYCAPVHIAAATFSKQRLRMHSNPVFRTLQRAVSSGVALGQSSEALCINAHPVGAALSFQPVSSEAHCGAMRRT
jgi:hypothetical protein